MWKPTTPHDHLKKKDLQQAINYFINEHNERRSVQGIADELSLHRVYFSRAFKKQFKVSPIEYSKQLRLLKAVSGLTKTTESLASVAYEAGYADQSHMNRSFKKSV